MQTRISSVFGGGDIGTTAPLSSPTTLPIKDPRVPLNYGWPSAPSPPETLSKDFCP